MTCLDASATLEDVGCSLRADGGAGLRVLIDPSGTRSRNIGDTAMLEVALARLRTFWPQAALQIHSFDSQSVRVVEPLNGASKRRRPRLNGDFLEAIRTANLVLMSGADGLNDACKSDALCRLETLELAMDCGAVTALVGQRIGPMSNPVLRSLAARILSKVDFIALRDSLDSLALLNDLGVDPSKVNIIGDDAVDLAYRARGTCAGTAMGVNLRVAGGSTCDVVLSVETERVVQTTAGKLRAAMQPLSVSSYDEEDDLSAAQLILRGASEPSSGLRSAAIDFLLTLPQCRIVVAGSYHAVVFALSMGIPAVGIVGCDYYVHKFRRLADQFGPACRVELTSHPDFYERLPLAIEAAWQSAPTAREWLLRSAVRQVAQGKAAYRRLCSLVESRAPHPGIMPLFRRNA